MVAVGEEHLEATVLAGKDFGDFVIERVSYDVQRDKVLNLKCQASWGRFLALKDQREQSSIH